MLRTLYDENEVEKEVELVSETLSDNTTAITNKKLVRTCTQRFFRPFIYTVPVVNALTDAGRVNRGMSVYNNDAFDYSITALGFLTSLGLGQRTIMHFDGSYQLIHDRHTPNDWPHITTKMNRIALSIAIASTLYISLSDAARSYGYAQRMPDDYHFADNISTDDWMIPSVTIAGITAAGALFNFGYNYYKLTYALLSDSKIAYANNFSRIASPVIGYAMGPFGAMNDVITNMTALYSITKSVLPAYVIAASTVPLSVLYYTFNSRFIRDSTNNFIKHAPNNYRSPKIVISFSAALAISGLLSVALAGLNEILLNSTMDAFEIESNDTYDTVITSLSWGGAANRFIVLTANIYPLTQLLINGTEKLFSKARAKITEYFDPTSVYTFSNSDQTPPQTTPDNTDIRHQTANVTSSDSSSEYTFEMDEDVNTQHPNDDDSDTGYETAEENNFDEVTDPNSHETIVNFPIAATSSQGIFSPDQTALPAATEQTQHVHSNKGPSSNV